MLEEILTGLFGACVLYWVVVVVFYQVEVAVCSSLWGQEGWHLGKQIIGLSAVKYSVVSNAVLPNPPMIIEKWGTDLILLEMKY